MSKNEAHIKPSVAARRLETITRLAAREVEEYDTEPRGEQHALVLLNQLSKHHRCCNTLRVNRVTCYKSGTNLTCSACN